LLSNAEDFAIDDPDLDHIENIEYLRDVDAEGRTTGEDDDEEDDGEEAATITIEDDDAADNEVSQVFASDISD
jgi:hypothetical protein